MKFEKKHTALALIIVALILYAIIAPPSNSNSKQNSARYTQQFCLNGVGDKTSLSIATSNGINCFRTDVSLNRDQISFIKNASNSSADYLGILDYVTVGAQPSQSGCRSGCNWSLATWKASVANAVADYPNIHEWEIYNEPLAGLFIGGYDNGSALNYFNMIKSASTIIKNKEPNATVVCFGGAELYPAISIEYEYPFYRQVWAYGASKYCDAISIHTYSLPYYNLNQTVAGNVTLSQFYNFTLNLYENLTKKPLWITETGITSNNWNPELNLSEQKQASFLNQDMNFFVKYQFVKRIYWFNLQDSPGTPDYGLINSTTLQPKPALYSYLYFSRNSIS